MGVGPKYKYDGYGTSIPSAEFYSNKNAFMFSFCGALFVQKNDYLWTLQNIKWRMAGECGWHKAPAGTALTLGNRPLQILVGENNAIQVTGKDWKEIPFLSVATMIAEIVKVVDYVELDSENVYALLKDSRPYLGCKGVLKLLIDGDMVEQVHKGLYRLVKGNINPRAFLDFEKEVTRAYERIVGR